jgi:hypothetical protein
VGDRFGPGSWRIIGGPYEVDGDEPTDGMAWIWVIRRGRAVRAVRVQVSARAWAERVNPGLAKSVRESIAARGATLIFEAVRADEPPSLILVDGVVAPAPSRDHRPAC